MQKEYQSEHAHALTLIKKSKDSFHLFVVRVFMLAKSQHESHTPENNTPWGNIAEGHTPESNTLWGDIAKGHTQE